MRRKLNFAVGLDFLFLILFLASSFGTGIVSDLIFYLAYGIPTVIGLIVLTRKKQFDGIGILPKKAAPKAETASEEDDPGEEPPLSLSSLLPFAAPTLLSVVLLSLLTSFLVGLIFGQSDDVTLPESLFEAIFLRALVPAVLEELFFRFLPLRILAGENKKSAVFYSALLFAALHCSLFRMPYAFAAGVLFAALDLAAGSLLPSLVLHFVNNVFGVLVIRYPAIAVPYIAALAVLTVLSVVLLIKKRETLSRFSFLTDKKCKLFLSGEPFILLLFTLYIAVAVLL